MYNLLMQLGIVLALVLAVTLIYFRLRKSRSIRILNASLTVEELELRAKRTAIDHVLTSKRVLLNWPVTRVNESYKKILDLYTELNDNLNHKRAVPPAAEWLLDNFYIIEEQVKGIRADMSKKSYYKLPVLRRGPFKGYTRVFAIAMEFTESVDGQIDESTLLRYLEAYQSHTILFDREIRMIPMMLRIALIESTRSLCENIKETQIMWNKANDIVDKWWSDDISDPEKIVKLFKTTIESIDEVNPSFIEHLFYRLRRSGRSYSNVLRYIDDHLATLGTDTERVAQVEHNRQAVSTVSMGNYIMSFRYITSVNWSRLFDTLSFVEKILDEDPMGHYASMDNASCSYYVRRIEKLAKQYGVSELHIAREAIALAKLAESEIGECGAENNEVLRRAHVGYYLIDKGLDTLLKGLKGKRNPREGFVQNLINWTAEKKVSLFIGTIAIFTAIIVFVAYMIALRTDEFATVNIQTVLLGILACIALAIPASELVIVLNNWVIGTIKSPAVFPRLELKSGIPDCMKTMVVVPAILSNNQRIDELLENIENHYLSNREDNLYFALIGAFKDSKTPDINSDQGLLNHAMDGVKALNEKYKREQEDRFYFYHRKSVYNKQDDIWTGWERKRGALMEFNAMLLGSTTTTFFRYTDKYLDGNSIKYIITLDADTVLPFDMAKKMIGTMAHPLNLPVIDPQRHIVLEGYGLMQPRVTFDMDSSNKSAFARIFTGLEGMDPYASAVSDVYQDLFGEGIFTGKGIYDLKVFYTVLKDVVPENAVLSHDLLEGSYVRAALVSDLELVDAYPTRYNSYMTRLQRWIRGDWQLIPWLNKIIYNKHNRLVLNPLSNISIWKIFDNLRRSLVAPSMILLIFLGLTILPGSGLFWIGFVGLVMWLPFIIVTIDQISIKNLLSHTSKRHLTGFFGLKASFFQIALNILFLPYQATVTIKAIVITLIRVFITKKNLLEWITSDDAEKLQDNTLKGYLSKMGLSALVGLPLVMLTYLLKPEALVISIVIAVTWLIGPFVAHHVSKGSDRITERLDSNSLLELRKTARRTWRYFEEYANAKNNFLAPDNVQVVPYRGVAHRTSPTNIGLGLLASLTARDFGYIGLLETIVHIDKTIKTVEKLDKWHGHLLNWYDTKTLMPLRPRYISTVDNGNFVCYLVTLVEGLKSFETLPIIDRIYLRGIEDTLANSKDSLSILDEHLSSVRNDEPIDAFAWYTALQSLLDAPALSEVGNDVWKIKTSQMLGSLVREIETFMPWLQLIASAPDTLDEDFMKKLRMNCTMDELVKTTNQIREANHKLLEATENEIIKEWHNKLDDALKVAVQNNEAFLSENRRLIERINKLSDETQFIHLYDERRQLFSIGYNLEDMRLTNSFYDLLASEARQTSYIAIARGEIPAKHWNKLGRSLTMVDRYKGLISWSGTMFEYLMPLILMSSYKNTLLDETYSFVVKSQIKYGNQRNMPWGASESAFNSIDLNLDYQYKAIGVPWLGLKRGLIDDAVVAPYATFLALMVDPVSAYTNIERMKKEGLEGPYGYYEAADYTPERLKDGEKSVVIKSYMAHHQGMTLMSLNNYLNDNVLQKRFSQDVHVKAARLLLQEKVPMHVIFTKDNKEKIVPFKGILYKENNAFRTFDVPSNVLPKAHVLSNGFYSVVTTDRGTGYSRTKDMAVTRWREDSIQDQYGMFFYLKNNNANETWSSAYAPYNVMPKNYEVVFYGDKTTYKRTDGDIDTLTEIAVTSGDNAEVRRIKVKNNGDETNTIEITSYFELVINNQNNDMAHPAFSNLFMETEYDVEHNALLAHRRPRKAGDKDQWIAQIAVIDGEIFGEYQYETDRMQFIGRGNTLKNPVSMQRDKPLSNTLGIVIDPIFSFRLSLKLDPKKSMRVSFVTMIADSREAIMELLTKYNNVETCDAAFWLAVIRSQVETRYLNIKTEEMILYQNMVSDILYLSPIRKRYEALMQQNTKGQSGLWPYGISGDRPILLLSMEKMEDVEILYEILKAHEYWRLKDLRVDLVILIKEENTYFNPLRASVNEIVDSVQTLDAAKMRGDIFILNDNNLPKEDLYLLYAVARMSFDAQNGPMAAQYEAAYERFATLGALQAIAGNVSLPISNEITQQPLNKPLSIPHFNEDANLQFFNGIGGFSPDGTTYEIHLENEQTTPLPWSNVIANKDFGFLTTESGGGYTWYGNSRENKLTPWSNDAVSDTPGEIIYLRDDTLLNGEATHDLWTVTALPIRETEPYKIEHGFGYTKFLHLSHGITQELTQFVPLEGAAKISLLTLTNDSDIERTLTVTYYVKPVMGDFESNTAMHLQSDITDSGTLIMRNPYNQGFPNQVLFMESSLSERTVCADRHDFFGSGSLQSPELLKQKALNNQVGSGHDACLAMQVTVVLKPLETVKLVLVLGLAETNEHLEECANRFRTIDMAEQVLSEVKAFWHDKLTTVQVETPDAAMNILLNGWLIYQVITCRIWARTAFYQAGGAFGFRDQLQDSLAVLTIWPELAREQILKHAAHQFVEGDVLHWWHEPAEKGPRTRMSDDYLWLPYVVSEYVKVTGDQTILDEIVPFLEDAPLASHEEERYSSPKVSDEVATLYAHCLRSLDYGLKFGEHGLPLMGGGDWNDGMNTVGIEGKGESVWLGWFLYKTLKMFVTHCTNRGDLGSAEKYLAAAETLAKAIDEHGWDGKWYRRAYFDDGSILGTESRSECKIDAIAQAWSVMSGAGDPQKSLKAMASVEDYLINKEDGIIKLLTPPFDKGDMEPGYIKGYVPGVRENGGQYSHAATWVIAAFAMLGEGDKAHELYELINPINHSNTYREMLTYKTEPYVMAADVYSVYPHIGRGGWSWYTGAAGWMYQVGLEYILGFSKEGDVINSNPNAPTKWGDVKPMVKYRSKAEKPE